MTAAIGAPLVMFLIWVSLWTTVVLLAIALLAAAYEYSLVIRNGQFSWRAYVFGFFYLGIPFLAAVWVRNHEDGAFWLLLTLVTNWLTDTAAYVFGRLWGNTPFAPKISPKKTWEGVFGGIAGGFLTAIGFSLILGYAISFAIIAIGILNPIATVIGDLIESRIKRRYGVKDSGTLLPGHGGILDRIDGTLPALVITALILIAFV